MTLKKVLQSICVTCDSNFSLDFHTSENRVFVKTWPHRARGVDVSTSEYLFAFPKIGLITSRQIKAPHSVWPQHQNLLTRSAVLIPCLRAVFSNCAGQDFSKFGRVDPAPLQPRCNPPQQPKGSVRMVSSSQGYRKPVCGDLCR